MFNLHLHFHLFHRTRALWVEVSPASNTTYINDVYVFFDVQINVSNYTPKGWSGWFADAWYNIDNGPDVSQHFAKNYAFPSQNDTSVWSKGSPSEIVYLSDGQHNLTITTQVTFVFGNPDSGLTLQKSSKYALPSTNFTVKNIPPVINVFSPQNKTYGTNSVLLNVTKTDYTSYPPYGGSPLGFIFDNSSRYFGNDVIPDLVDGLHQLTALANGFNNVTVFFTIDTTPPNILDLSIENKTYSGVDLPLTFSTNESTSWVGYSLDSQANVTVNGNFTLEGLTEGTHSIVIYANDNVGNMGKSDTAFFTVNTATPSPKAKYSTGLVLVAIIIVVVALVVALVYFKKRKK